MENFIFQVGPDKEYRLTEAIAEMRHLNETCLLLSPHIHTEGNRNQNPNRGDIVYFWESERKHAQPKRKACLIARGKVLEQADIGRFRDMPDWQQTFCVDEKTGRGGAQFHQSMPRTKIEIERPSTARRVDREVTDRDDTLRGERRFLKKHAFYTGTVFGLTEAEARQLDRLAQW